LDVQRSVTSTSVTEAWQAMRTCGVYPEGIVNRYRVVAEHKLDVGHCKPFICSATQTLLAAKIAVDGSDSYRRLVLVVWMAFVEAKCLQPSHMWM